MERRIVATVPELVLRNVRCARSSHLYSLAAHTFWGQNRYEPPRKLVRANLFRTSTIIFEKI